MLRKGTLWLAALLPLAVAAPVDAQDFVYYNVCGVAGNTALKVCASADLTLSGNTLIMRVWNMEIAGGTGAASYGTEFGGWHTITSVGLQYVGAGSAGDARLASARYVFGSGANQSVALTLWRDVDAKGVRNPLQVEIGSSTSGNKEGVVGCTDPGPSSAGHVATCGSYGFMPYVEFTFTNVTLPYQFADYNFEFHGQQMLNGYSAKGSGPGDYPPSEVVPEPITMVLLGSGLLGVGGVNLRRRRKEEETEEV